MAPYCSDRVGRTQGQGGKERIVWGATRCISKIMQNIKLSSPILREPTGSIVVKRVKFLKLYKL